jgi:hypothetical protein
MLKIVTIFVLIRERFAPHVVCPQIGLPIILLLTAVNGY